MKQLILAVVLCAIPLCAGGQSHWAEEHSIINSDWSMIHTLEMPRNRYGIADTLTLEWNEADRYSYSEIYPINPYFLYPIGKIDHEFNDKYISERGLMVRQLQLIRASLLAQVALCDSLIKGWQK